METPNQKEEEKNKRRKGRKREITRLAETRKIRKIDKKIKNEAGKSLVRLNLTRLRGRQSNKVGKEENRKREKEENASSH